MTGKRRRQIPADGGTDGRTDSAMVSESITKTSECDDLMTF